MRAYTFALYVLGINMLIQVFMAVPLFGAANDPGNISYAFNSTYNYSVGNGTVLVMPYDANFTEAGNLSTYHPGGMTEINFFDAIAMLATAFWRSTVYLPWFLGELGFPSLVYWPLAIMVWFVYAFGVIQFLTGRTAKSYE